MNAAAYLLVYSVVCCLSSVMLPFFHYLLFTGGYVHRRPGRKQRDGACTIKFRPDVSGSFLSKRALVQSRVQCSLVQVLLQTLKVQFGAFHCSIRHLQVLIVGFTHYTVATYLLMYS